MKYTVEKKKEYENRWANMVITRPAQAQRTAELIRKGKPRYQAISAQTGVPWEFIGLVHYRECACNFRGVLHNGELIVGTNKKTRLVPDGHGPFATWEEAALHALRLKGLDKERDWSIGRFAYKQEGFNGYGYSNRGLPSPYLWGGTNQYSRGKYVRDRVFDPNFVDPQMGVMPVLKLLLQTDQPRPKPQPPSPPPPTPKPRPTLPPEVAVAAPTLAALWAFAESYLLPGLCLLATVVALRALYKHRRKRLLARSSPKAE
jgi:lysozyme family protein